MLTEFDIRTPESCNSVLMYCRVTSKYAWKHTVKAGDNSSGGIIVSIFTQNVA